MGREHAGFDAVDHFGQLVADRLPRRGVERHPDAGEAALAQEGVLGADRRLGAAGEGGGRRGVHGELEPRAAERGVVGGELAVVVGLAGLVVRDDQLAIGELVDPVDAPLEPDLSAVRQGERDRPVVVAEASF